MHSKEFLNGNKFLDFWHDGFDFDLERKMFLEALDNSQNESDIQSYIKNNNKWFIPASIFEQYDFGHHEAYIFPEKSLGSEYRTDYILVGSNSVGHHIVLIEFEDVKSSLILKTRNEFSESVRKGISQLQDWKRWITYNLDYFLKSFNIPNLQSNVAPWSYHYCLVVGRRIEENKMYNELRSNYRYENHIDIISYDRLADYISRLWNGF